jgi:hypothetical protein
MKNLRYNFHSPITILEFSLTFQVKMFNNLNYMNKNLYQLSLCVDI